MKLTKTGKMVEWFNTSVLKTEKVNSFQGSNPCLSNKIWVSILSIDNLLLKSIFFKLILSNFKNFHIDIMEYSYVKNSSFSINNIKSIKKYFFKLKKIYFEYHIMTKNNNNFIKKFSICILHLENIFFIKNLLSITPNFCWKYIKFLNKNFLLMSVNPGFGNQTFLKFSIKKFLKYSIDGGINLYIYKNIKNYFKKIIIGTNIISKKNYLSYFLYNFIQNEYNI